MLDLSKGCRVSKDMEIQSIRMSIIYHFDADTTSFG